MKFSKRFIIKLYILFAIFTIIIPIGLLSVLLQEAILELLTVFLLCLVFLLVPTFIIYGVFSDLYDYIKEINNKDSAFKHSAIMMHLAKFLGVIPIYEQLEGLAHEYKMLYQEKQLLFNTIQFDALKCEKPLIIEDDTISLSSNYNLNNFIDTAIKTICYLTKADSCSMMLYDEEIDALKIVASAGLSPNLVEEFILKPGEGIAGKVYQEHKAIIVEDVTKDSQFVFSSKQTRACRALYSAPIKTPDECIGVINIDTKTPLPKDKREIVEGIVNQISIAIKNAHLFKSMEELAVRDSLTGLYTRRYFNQVLAKEVERAVRYSRSLSLVILDIDNFKQYNDNYGHMVGDYLLKEIGRTIQDNLRSSDVLTRYGGDELAIILPETDKHSAYALMERIRRRVSERHLITQEVLFHISNEFINENSEDLLIKSNTVWDKLFGWLKIAGHGTKHYPPAKVTLSAGICSLSKNIISEDDLIKEADNALLKAKRKGKNNICICTCDHRVYSKATV